MIWFTSDMHFCHDRDFIYGKRGFSSVDEMNRVLIENMRSVVQPDDELYVLGDCFLEDNDAGMALMRQLPGKVRIIFGNHDSDTRVGLMEEEFDCRGFAERIRYKGYTFYLSHYPALTSNYSDDSQKESVINICGHSHTTDRFCDMDKGLIYHVEPDCHDNYPVSVDEIISDIRSLRS